MDTKGIDAVTRYLTTMLVREVTWDEFTRMEEPFRSAVRDDLDTLLGDARISHEEYDERINTAMASYAQSTRELQVAWVEAQTYYEEKLRPAVDEEGQARLNLPSKEAEEAAHELFKLHATMARLQRLTVLNAPPQISQEEAKLVRKRVGLYLGEAAS